MPQPPDNTSDSLILTVAYCGLVCGVCVHSAAEREACVGCRNGGGSKNCHQRRCCVEKGLDGCWECESFPCNQGFFGDDAWRGLCVGSVQCIKAHGLAGYVERLAARVGRSVELGDYRHKSPEEVRHLLCGEPDSA